MSFAAVGSSFTWDTTPINFTPVGVGNLVVIGALTKLAQTPIVTNISSSNATWTKLTTDYDGTVSNTGGNIWVGLVTSASLATVTLTWSGAGSPPSFWQLDGHEFSSTVGSWSLDQQGTVDTNTANNAYASLTPAGAGELYFGTNYDDTGSIAGSTPGYTYVVDSHGNGMLYNVNCGAGVQTPTWGDNAVFGGVMALIREGLGGVSGTGAVTIPKMTLSGTGRAPVIGTGAVTIPKMTVSGSSTRLYGHVATTSDLSTTISNSSDETATVTGSGGKTATISTTGGT